MLTPLPTPPVFEVRYEPLHVVLRCAPVAGFGTHTLDGLLAAAVVAEATDGLGVTDPPGLAWDIPLPLQCLARDGRGLPLWAATAFWPVGVAVPDQVYHHRRAPDGQHAGAKKGKLSISKGDARYSDYRIPTPTLAAEEWEAWCIGDLAEVARLLEAIPGLGKHVSRGQGWILERRVERCEAVSWVRDGRLLRSWPAELWPEDLPAPDAYPTPVGWTPPGWRSVLWSDGWRAGAVVEEVSHAVG